MNKHQELRFAAAIEYANKGWRVLPVGTNKKPINHNGSTGATTDIKQIFKWWEEHPFANVGIACGPESFFVVDIDVKDGKNGINSLNKHFGDHWSFDVNQNLCAKTPTGGIHLLFKYPSRKSTRSPKNSYPS